VTETKFPEGSVAAVGNEGNGLSAAAVEACAGRVTIPMPGRAESLNAAASAAILMWEMMRTRGK
jgi:TrmH family RNA methyltransferase